jgi:hypothetical protein
LISAIIGTSGGGGYSSGFFQGRPHLAIFLETTEICETAHTSYDRQS